MLIGNGGGGGLGRRGGMTHGQRMAAAVSRSNSRMGNFAASRAGRGGGRTRGR